MDVEVDSLHFVLSLIASVLVIASGVRRVAAAQKRLIFRFGKFYRIVGNKIEARFYYLIPGVDRSARVELDEVVPEWRALSESDIDNRVKAPMSTSANNG